MSDAELAEDVRNTDWAVELAAAMNRYVLTPRWRFVRRRVHRQSMASCLWFLEQQEAGRL